MRTASSRWFCAPAVSSDSSIPNRTIKRRSKSLAALACIHAAFLGSGAPALGSSSQGAVASSNVLVGGLLTACGPVIDWSVIPGVSYALIGSLDEPDGQPLVLLPLSYETMALDDWLALGIAPAQAASLIASMAAGDSLHAVVGIDGDVLSVIVSSSISGAAASSVFVVTTPPGAPASIAPEAIDFLRDLLRRLREQFGIIPPPPPPPPPPGDGPLPDGAW